MMTERSRRRLTAKEVLQENINIRQGKKTTRDGWDSSKQSKVKVERMQSSKWIKNYVK